MQKGLHRVSFIPAYPRIDATIRENKTGELTINGTSHPIVAADLARLRAGVTARCAATACPACQNGDPHEVQAKPASTRIFTS
jgi:hypothetical protein